MHTVLILTMVKTFMKYSDDLPANFSQRDPAAGVDTLFHQRWSPRSFKKVEISEDDLKTIFDAARWAPSCFNGQPWRIYTSTPASFDRFLNLLGEGNQVWAKNAGVLGFMVAKLAFDHNGKPNAYAEFDTGAAWMTLTLQARKLGLYTHGMGGILHDQVYEAFNIDREQYKVIAGFAIGVIDTPDKLPEDKQKMEQPSARKSLQDIWHPVG